MEEILSAFEDMDLEDPESIFPEQARAAFENLILDSLLPKTSTDDRPGQRKNFLEFHPVIEKNLSFVKSFLAKLKFLRTEYNVKNFSLKKSTVVLLLMLCGEHVNYGIWSTEKCKYLVQDILKMSCELCNCSKLKDLLVHENIDESMKLDPLFKPVLLALRPKLLNVTWEAYPAAVACFCWLLPHVKSPNLSDHLDSVLPTALLLADDYRAENRLLGVNALHHIVDNIPRTHLCWNGQADVIYHALFKMVYSLEKLDAAPVLNCLVLIVDKLESGPNAKDDKLKWSRRDDVLELLLQQMEKEQRPELRLAFAEALPALLRPLGVASCRWARRIVRVLQFYLECASYGDHHLRTTARMLDVLGIFIELAGERVELHATRLACILLRLMADMTSSEVSKPRQDLSSLVKRTLDTLVALFNAAPHSADFIIFSLWKRCKEEGGKWDPPFRGAVNELLAKYPPRVVSPDVKLTAMLSDTEMEAQEKLVPTKSETNSCNVNA